MAIELPQTAIPTNVQLYNPENFPTTESSASSSSSGSSRAGIDQNYISQIMASIIPQLTNSVDNFEGNVDEFTGQAAGLARNQGQDMLSQILQTNMNSLVGRGMANSKVAGTALGAATGDVLKNVQNQTMQAGMEGAKLKLGMPDMLGQLAQLGNVSTGSQSAEQQSQSLAQDPSVPDRIIATLFSGSV